MTRVSRLVPYEMDSGHITCQLRRFSPGAYDFKGSPIIVHIYEVNLKVVGVRLDLDAGHGIDLVIRGLQARRSSLIETQCIGKSRVGGIKDDGSIEILCGKY